VGRIRKKNANSAGFRRGVGRKKDLGKSKKIGKGTITKNSIPNKKDD